MPFTYSGDPSGSNRDAVRFLVGDTDGDTFQLHDAEIDFALTQNGNRLYAAAADAATALAARLVGVAEHKRVGDLTLIRKDHDRLLALAASWRAIQEDADSANVGPVVTGRSFGDKESAEDDSDRVPPYFTRGRDDYPGTTIGGASASTLTGRW